MSTLKIGTYENKTQYHPGEEIAGRALWILDRPPKAVEVRLFWYTEGKGTQDVELIDSVRFDKPSERGEDDFRFTLPNEPYSFSGKLISLIWALELVVLPSDETERFPITVSPTGFEVFLHKGEVIEVANEGT